MRHSNVTALMQTVAGIRALGIHKFEDSGGFRRLFGEEAFESYKLSEQVIH